MADCLISPVIEIGKCILTECAWPPIKSHFDYWWCFHDNIQGLSQEVGELDLQISNLKQKREEVRLRIGVVKPEVEEWLKASDKKLEEARRILQDDNIPKAWNLISRYSMGKNAKKTAEGIAKLRKDGDFNTIADPAPPPAMASPPHRSTTYFESRKHIEEDIIKSLKESSVDVIEICGMGGVGKTTMAQRIRKRVKDENLFDEVVMVTVSQKIDMLKIQEEVAEWLELKLDGKHLATRAAQLRTRLMDIKRKIIIFDDVWESLRFEDLGIPIESSFERCKVLLTSRSADACKGIKNNKVFKLEILEEDEAWLLFKDKAGDCVEDLVLNPVAKEVVAECKGLPIALVTVGLSLRDKRNIHKWKDSLSQLRKSNPTDFSEVLRDVYKPLKLSYDCLDNDSERNLFLLCCLFPEDFDISVEQLTRYSMGLGLFDDINNIEEARNRTHTLIEKLKSRFLLIEVEKDGKNEFEVKMHDVIRDVAIYIGSREKDGFLKSLTSVKNSSDVNCNWMSVDISHEGMEVPVLSRFPKLRLLMFLNWSSNELSWSSNELSDISFEGMKDLNVLSFEIAWFGSLPPTLGSLENLQTLCLFYCVVENISVIGKLTSLKILSCYGCHNIVELPSEIGRLKGLRLLELTRCRKLKRIPFGIISSLRGLEELKMRGSFMEWEAEENGKETRNASLRELECLPNLSCLEIEIDDCTLSAQEICLSLNLVKYYIRISSISYYFGDSRDYEKVMILKLPSHIGAVGKWIQMQVRNTEYLALDGDGCGSNNFNIAEIKNLRDLGVTNCSTLKKLVETKDCEFHNLKSIQIKRCPKLKSLFSVSTLRSCLLQLENLWIGKCKSMEQVFWNEGTDDNTYGCIEFPKLKELKLWFLPNLTAFCQGLENIIIKFPNLTELSIEKLPKLNSLSPLNSETHDQNTCFHFLCNPKVQMASLENLTLWNLGDNIRNIWCHQIPNNVFNNLENLDIAFMNGIRSLMSTSIAKNLVSLKWLSIKNCEEMVEVIERDDGDKQVVDTNCLFSTLTELSLVSLPKLKRFWQWNHSLELPLLKIVQITSCPVIETFTLGSINTPTLREICVNNSEIDYQNDLNDVIRHIWTKSQYTSKTDGDRNENENEDKDESKNEYNNENVNKDKDSNERK